MSNSLKFPNVSTITPTLLLFLFYLSACLPSSSLKSSTAYNQTWLLPGHKKPSDFLQIKIADSQGNIIYPFSQKQK
jgi:hypothetical protein